MIRALAFAVCALHGALALALQAAAAPQVPAPASAFDVRSADGRFVAQVRSIEIGKPDSDRARMELAVYAERDDGELRKQWSAPYAPPKSSARHLLTDDGTTFVRVIESAAEDVPLVDVTVKGLRLAAWKASELGVRTSAERPPQGDGKVWLAGDTQAVRLRSPGELNANACLDLLGRDGFVRTIDLVTGSLVHGVPVEGSAVRVEPAPPDDFAPSKLACVEKWSAPALALQDDACPVRIEGNFPTPGWVLVGFAIKESDSGGLAIVPCVVPPPAKTLQAQVLVGFESTALLSGLAPGVHALTVETCVGRDRLAARSLEVLPSAFVASLKTTGGIAGAERAAVVFSDAHAQTSGRDGAERRAFLVAPDELASIVRGVQAIGADIAAEKRGTGADLMTYELTWIEPRAGHIRRVTRDDRTLEPPLRAVVERLNVLKPAPQARLLELDIHKSTIRVRTGSSGLLGGAFGHDHDLMVQRLSGEVWMHPDDLEHARVFLAVESGSLAVVDNDSQDDRAAIEREMNATVLETARYPRITFRSTAVHAVRASGAHLDLEVRGILALHGVARGIALPLSVELTENSLRARGELRLRQSDFKIRPTSAAAGTIKVDDEVKLTFDVVANAP